MSADPGALRETVRLQQRAASQDSTGEQAWLWAEIGLRRAAVEPLSGAERVSAEQRQARVSTRFRLRRDSLTAGLRPQDRIDWRGRTFDLIALLEDPAREWLVVVADELVGETLSGLDVGRTLRLLTLAEIGIYGGGWGLCPLGASGLFQGSTLIEVRV